MKFIIQKESFNNSLRLTEKITAQKTVQPVLSNVLIETVGDNSLKFSATDLDLAIEIFCNRFGFGYRANFSCCCK